MSGMAPGTSDTSIYILLAIIVLVFVRRIYYMVQGTRVQPARLVGYAVVYVALFLFTVGLSDTGEPVYVYAIEAVVAVVAALLSDWYVARHVVLERRPPDNAWYFKLHPWIPILYVVLFIARVAISLEVLGANAFDFAPPSVPLSSFDLLLLEVVDILFAGSTGFLVGRSVGVYRAYRRESAKALASPPPSAPPPAGSSTARPLP